MTYSTSRTRSAGTDITCRPRPHSWSTVNVTEAVEEWRPAVGLEGRYEVSDQGRVRNVSPLARVAIRKLNHSGRYATVCIYLPPKHQNLLVHRMVCEAFHGPKPEWADCVRHLNDQSYDNRAVNLAWGTHADNMQDRTRNGRNPEARRTACDNGHPYVEGSFSIDRGARRCLVCHREKEKARKARLMADVPIRRCPAIQKDGNRCVQELRRADYCSRHHRMGTGTTVERGAA